MSRKKDDNSWIQNIEYIFTKEKLDELVEQRFIERIKRNNRFYYIKFGCKDLLR